MLARFLIERVIYAVRIEFDSTETDSVSNEHGGYLDLEVSKFPAKGAVAPANLNTALAVTVAPDLSVGIYN